MLSKGTLELLPELQIRHLTETDLARHALPEAFEVVAVNLRLVGVVVKPKA